VTQVQVVNVVQIQIVVQVAAAETTKEAAKDEESSPSKISRDGERKGKDKYRSPGDGDRDGLSDDQERLISTDPDDVDTDDDGLNDGTEVLVESTDPLNADTDDDGVDDGDETEVGTDPTRADTDRDGIEDGQELQDGSNPLDPNDPAETDADGDGLTLREERELGTDSNDLDTDGDGVDDGSEVESYGSSPLAFDTDGDGLGDGSEVDRGTDPTDPDTDGDGLTDRAELVRGTDPTDPDDPAPPDPDEDDLGTPQEEAFGTDPNDDDTDDDDLEDGREVSSTFTDPVDDDTDGDGIPDGEEVANGSDPLDVNDPTPIDADDDGLPDETEAGIGTNASDPDTDGDGVLDGTEVDDGTDPLDPDDPPRVTALQVGTDCENVTVTNPNAVPVTVTVTGPDGTVQAGVAAGETLQVVASAGDFTLRASTGDGTTVPLGDENETELDVAVAECPTVAESLTVVERERNVSVTNPNDAPVTVIATDEADAAQNETVPANESVTLGLDPGSYTLAAAADDGARVPLNGDPTVTVSIAPAPTEANVAATVENGTLTVANPSAVNATANLTNETGPVESFDVATGAFVTVSDLAPGNYTLTATAAGNATAQVNGNDSFAFTVRERGEEFEALGSLNATVENATLTVENPNDVAVTVTATNDSGTAERLDVPANDTGTLTELAPGNWTATATAADGRQAPIDGNETFTFTVAAPEEQSLASLNATVENATLTVENPNDVAVTVTATNETGATRTLSVDANGTGTLTELAPGNWTATATSEATDSVLIDGNETVAFTVEATAAALDSLVVVVGNETFTVENPNEQAVSVTVSNDSGPVDDTTVEAGVNATGGGLAPGNYTLNGTSADGRTILLNGNETLRIELVGAPVDSDGDGLTDEREAELGTNATRADTDGDGRDDGEEVAGETDPRHPDTDLDAMTDGGEVAAGTDPRNQSDPGFVDPDRYGFDPDDPNRSIFWLNPAVAAHMVDEPQLVDAEAIARLVHERVNEIRVANGLDPLTFNDTVASVARAHSADMAARDFLDTVNPDDEGPLDRSETVLDDGACSAYGENVQGISGPVTNEEIADAVVAAWLNSSEKRSTILDPDWDSEGIGVYFTQESINDTFAAPGEVEGLLGQSEVSLLVTQDLCDEPQPTTTTTEATPTTTTQTAVETTTEAATTTGATTAATTTGATTTAATTSEATGTTAGTTTTGSDSLFTTTQAAFEDAAPRSIWPASIAVIGLRGVLYGRTRR